jgi:ribosomal protein S18 acetylase RimI-like enzyme
MGAVVQGNGVSTRSGRENGTMGPVRYPHEIDIDAIKCIADECRAELGFHTRASFAESLHRNELLVAQLSGRVVGFLRFHHARVGHTTLREVGATSACRGRGLGREPIKALVTHARERGSHAIKLSCPVELPANEFYHSLGHLNAKTHSA